MNLILLIITTLFMNSFSEQNKNVEQATLGGGCFWCTEAIFLRLNGVEEVKSGYSGGKIKNPSYREVCTGRTGHAEVIQITFDPKIISFAEILEVFFATHDPTTLNRQGNDIGTQYRSVIFYHNEEQKKIAEKVLSLLEKDKVYDNPVVTEITPFSNFYLAEDYHNNYFEQNPAQPYCQFVIAPKVEKFQKIFKEKLKQPAVK
jgi:peptide-methionine (S)-S-oxide reductase